MESGTPSDDRCSDDGVTASDLVAASERRTFQTKILQAIKRLSAESNVDNAASPIKRRAPENHKELYKEYRATVKESRLDKVQVCYQTQTSQRKDVWSECTSKVISCN